MTERQWPPLIRQLMAEHEVVERVVGSLFRWSLEGQEKDPGARGVYLRFFREWVAGLHHRQEEDILFPALVDRVEVPSDRGPLRIVKDEHEVEAGLVAALEAASAGAETARVVKELAHLLWAHIDKEDSVLLYEAGERLGRAGALDLVGREATEAEDEAREAAESLVERWPPLEDDDLFRGDGCMACSAYGATCSGVEKEWWNEWEWERYRLLGG